MRALAILAGLALSLLLSVVNPTPATAGKAIFRRHVVKRGDTLHELAQRYGCTVEVLRRANQLGDVLPLGKILQVPACGQVTHEARLDPRSRRGAEPRASMTSKPLATTSPEQKPARQRAAAPRQAEELRRRDERRRVVPPGRSVQALTKQPRHDDQKRHTVSEGPVLLPQQLEAELAEPTQVPAVSVDPPDDLPVLAIQPAVAAPAPKASEARDANDASDASDLPEVPDHARPDVVLNARSLEALTPSVTAPSGQSLGLPWRGRLQQPSRLQTGEGYVLRRQHRTWGTETTVAHVRDALAAFRQQVPSAHELAIGDLSAESGGPISDHRSHQSGRDIDVGLVFVDKPPGYPESFVVATESNLDAAATWALITAFAKTAKADGGVSLILLDFEVQGIVYDWALKQGVDETVLHRVFQYPHGKRAAKGLVRHAPNHADHLHVRFACGAADVGCL